MTSPPRKPAAASRLRSWLVSALSALGLTALFALGALAALLLHLNLPAGRRASATLVGSLLANVFNGQVSIGTIARLSPGELEAEGVSVRDQNQRVVLRLDGIRLQANLLDVLMSLLRSDGTVAIAIGHVRIERAEALLLDAGDGLPTLVHALTPRGQSLKASASEQERSVRVWLPAIEVGKAFARGSIAGSPTLEAEIAAARGSFLATPDGAAVDVARFALLARGLGGADAKGIASLHLRSPGAVWGSFDGYMGDVQFGSVARWQQAALDLKLDLPRAEPAGVRALLGEWPLRVPATLRVHVKGQLPELDVELMATVGERASLNGTGSVNLAGPPRLKLNATGRNLDLQALWDTAPPTSFDIDSTWALRLQGGKLQLELGGSLKPSAVGVVPIPAIEFSGATTERGFGGEATLHDLGLPIALRFLVHTSGRVELDAEAQQVNLAGVSRIKPYVDATGNLDLRAHASFDHGQLDARLTSDIRNLSYAGATLSSGKLSASATGPLNDLQGLTLAAQLNGKRLGAGRFSFQDVSATAGGPLRAPRVAVLLADSSGPSIDAQATLAWGQVVSMQKLSLGVLRDGAELRGDVAELTLSDSSIRVRDLTFHGGSGELQGGAEVTPDALNVSLHGENLDLSAISRVLGLRRGELEGRASLSVDAVSSARERHGTLELSVSKAAVAHVNGLTAKLSARLDGLNWSGSSTGKVEGLGAFAADWDTTLAGIPTKQTSFERATGSAQLELQGITLDYLGRLLPEPHVDVTGLASLTLKATRASPDAMPSLELSAETQGLRARLTRDPEPAISVSGVDLRLSATHDGPTGSTSAALSAEQGSERIGSASLDMTLDLMAAVHAPASWFEELRSRPILAKVLVNRVDLESLPAALRVPNLRGSVRLEGTLRGTAAAPIASLGVRAADLRYGAGDHGEPVDLCGSAEYSKETTAFNVGAEVFLQGGFQLTRAPCSGRRIANLRFAGQAPFDFEHGIPAWSGTATAALESLPLATIPSLAEARVQGSATGVLIVDRSGEDPKAAAQLQLAGLTVDRLRVGDGTLNLRSNKDQAHADFEVAHGSASAQGSVSAGISWATQAPALDDAQPLEISLRGNQLEASVLEPFLDDFVSELHGTVDGDLTARLAPLTPGAEARQMEHIRGGLVLRDGSFILTGLGFRLHDVGFIANAEREGKTTRVDVSQIVANAGTKTHNLNAKLSLRLSGSDIASGSGSFNINSLPLVVDGVTRGTADAGVTRLELSRNSDRVLVTVPFERLVVNLPDAPAHDLIALNEHPDVTLLQPILQPKARRDEQALPWQFVIHLGERAKVKRGSELDIPITGDPIVVLAAGVGVTGSIFLPAGRSTVQVFGRAFQIEGGAVVFDTPDPKDPRLDVRASWRSSSNDTLFMYISGTLSNPQVLFDRPQADALALLAGTTDSSVGAANIGVSALDSLLASTPLSRLQLRGKDSTDGSTGATYTAAYRASDRVTVEGNYQQAAGNANPDNTFGVAAAVDWRLTRALSLRAQLGTIGTGVDLVYQYRY